VAKGRAVKGRVAMGRAAMGQAGTGWARMGQVGIGREKMGRLETGRSGTGWSLKKLQRTFLLLTGYKLDPSANFYSKIKSHEFSEKFRDFCGRPLMAL
jgi:hypothetical protein